MRSEPVQNRFRVLALSLAFLCAAAVLQGTASAEEGRSSARAEYEVKAAFVYNFVKFVEWPDAAGLSHDRVRLCVLGDLPDAPAFLHLDGTVVRGKKVSVVALKDAVEVHTCDVLFVATNQSGRLPDVIGSLKDRPVLTIGDTEGYALRGVMINMFLENKRIRFEINEEQAKSAGLRISVKLLKLASKVYGTGQDEDEEE
jgi:hypothetical protein